MRRRGTHLRSGSIGSLRGGRACCRLGDTQIQTCGPIHLQMDVHVVCDLDAHADAQ